MLQEANGSKRQELLQHANADQINAVSELVLNAAYFKDFTRCYVNVLDRPVNPGHMDHPVTRGQSGHRPVERGVSLLEA